MPRRLAAEVSADAAPARQLDPPALGPQRLGDPDGVAPSAGLMAQTRASGAVASAGVGARPRRERLDDALQAVGEAASRRPLARAEHRRQVIVAPTAGQLSVAAIATVATIVDLEDDAGVEVEAALAASSVIRSRGSP